MRTSRFARRQGIFNPELWITIAVRKRELLVETANVVVAHKNHLWNIANHFEIQEAHEFDQQLILNVPESLQDQIEPDDLEQGEAMSCKELLEDFRKSSSKLWSLPDKKLVSSRRDRFQYSWN